MMNPLTALVTIILRGVTFRCNRLQKQPLDNTPWPKCGPKETYLIDITVNTMWVNGFDSRSL